MLDIRYDGILPHNGKKWGYDITHQFRGVPENYKVLILVRTGAVEYRLYVGEKMGDIAMIPTSLVEINSDAVLAQIRFYLDWYKGKQK